MENNFTFPINEIVIFCEKIKLINKNKNASCLVDLLFDKLRLWLRNQDNHCWMLAFRT